MKYIETGMKGDPLKVSKIVLGTDYFGSTVPEETVFRLLDAYLDAGGNCIDTARIYASWVPGGDGASERTIGKWMKLRGCRGRVLLSTKGGHPPLERMNSGRLNRRDIEGDLDESLKTLGTDVIDLYWLHRDDATHPVEDIMETLSILVRKGKVRAIGCSNWKTARIAEANRGAGRMAVSSAGETLPAKRTPAAEKQASEADKSAPGPVAFCASQIQWSLASSTPEVHGDPTIVCMDDTEYRWYEQEHFPVFAYSSQAKGFFARGAAMGLDAINKKALARFATPENISRLERVREYAAESGLTVSAVSLGYLLCNRVPSAAIVGCKNMEQLEDSLTAANVSLPEHIVDWLYHGR